MSWCASSCRAVPTLSHIKKKSHPTTRFIFSAGAPFTRRDRTCGSGHFGVWMHSCISRIKPASSHFCRKLHVSRVRAPRGTSKQFEDIKSVRRNGVAENCWETGGCIGLDYLGNGMEWPDQNHFMSNHVESVSQDPAWDAWGFRCHWSGQSGCIRLGWSRCKGFSGHHGPFCRMWAGRSKWWVEELHGITVQDPNISNPLATWGRSFSTFIHLSSFFYILQLLK